MAMDGEIEKSNSDQHKERYLNQIIASALSESAKLISLLGQNKLQLKLEQTGVGTRSILDDLVNAELTDALAICHTIEGVVPGKIVFLLDDALAHQFIQAVLNDPHQLKDMSEMEEEALTEIGNVVVNNFLKHILQGLNQSLITRLPTLKRGSVEQIFDGFNSEVSSAFEQGTFYYARFGMEVSELNLSAYIFWFNPFFVSEKPPLDSLLPTTE